MVEWRSIVKKFLLAVTLLLFVSPLMAQSIYRYGGGLNLTQEPVTAKISGDFLALGLQAGFVPLSFDGGTLTWSGNTIATVDYLFISGAVEPGATGVVVDANWWFGPVIGAGEVQQGSIDVAHGFLGGTAGVDIGVGNLSLTAGIDTVTSKFYAGISQGIQFDLGGPSLIQIH